MNKLTSLLLYHHFFYNIKLLYVSKPVVFDVHLFKGVTCLLLLEQLV